MKQANNLEMQCIETWWEELSHGGYAMMIFKKMTDIWVE